MFVLPLENLLLNNHKTFEQEEFDDTKGVIMERNSLILIHMTFIEIMQVN
jgi:hypothetical protein